jgi:hypothetical protein
MAVVKTVTSGQPIKAGWANSLVNEVNTKQGLQLRGRAASTTSLRSIKPDNDPAFQVNYTHGTYSINAGQIYINGILVKTENDLTSFNQYSSCSNWNEECNHTPSSENDLPIWYIELTYPKNLTEENKEDVECELHKITKGGVIPDVEEENNSSESEEPGVENEKATIKKIIQLTDVIDGLVVQLISGSIYINDAQKTISLIEGDGISITEQSNTFTIGLNLSIISEDGIVFKDEVLQNKTRVVTLRKPPCDTYIFHGDVTE